MKVAITGGIGSGKSFVCRRLEQHGIQVYDCDAAAKRLMRESGDLRRKLCTAVGEGLYINNVLQKAVLSCYLLGSEENARRINDIVHPAVAEDFMHSGYDWLESAIFFDSGFNSRVYVDRVVCVTAPLETRIARVMARDSISREKTLEWIARQLPQEVVVTHSDYEIVNDGNADIDAQIDKILNQMNHINH